MADWSVYRRGGRGTMSLWPAIVFLSPLTEKFKTYNMHLSYPRVHFYIQNLKIQLDITLIFFYSTVVLWWLSGYKDSRR